MAYKCPYQKIKNRLAKLTYLDTTEGALVGLHNLDLIMFMLGLGPIAMVHNRTDISFQREKQCPIIAVSL